MAPLLLPRSALLPNAMDSSAKVMAKSFDELHEMWRVYCDRHRIGGPELFRRSDELALLWQANADFRNDQQTLLLHLRQEQLFEVQEQFLLQLRQKQLFEVQEQLQPPQEQLQPPQQQKLRQEQLFEVQEQLQPPQEQLQPPQQQTKPAYSKPWPRRAMRTRARVVGASSSSSVQAHPTNCRYPVETSNTSNNSSSVPAYSKPWPRRAMRKRVHAMQNKTTAPIAAPA